MNVLRSCATFLFLLLLIGCGQSEPAMPTAVSQITPTATVLPTITAVAPTATFTPTSQPTATPTKTATPMATNTPMPTPTPAPLPTLPPAEAEALLLDLLYNNAGCQLPCWWGAVPGETAWSGFKPFLATFISRIVPLSPPGRPLQFYEVTTGHWTMYAVRDGIIDNIETNWGRSPTYSLPQILTTYGPPDEVWLMTFQDTPDGSLPFRMSLLYAEKGIVVSYRVENIEKQFVPYQLVWCPHNNEPRGVSLWLVSPEREAKLTFDEARERTLHISAEEPYLRLSEATDMDEISFYEAFKDPTTSTCLETPVLLWPLGW